MTESTKRRVKWRETHTEIVYTEKLDFSVLRRWLRRGEARSGEARSGEYVNGSKCDWNVEITL